MTKETQNDHRNPQGPLSCIRQPCGEKWWLKKTPQQHNNLRLTRQKGPASFKSCIKTDLQTLVCWCPWSHISPSPHRFLPIIPNPCLFSRQLFTHLNLRRLPFQSAGEVHRSPACYILLACNNHLDSLLLACTQPSFIQSESTPQPGIISWSALDLSVCVQEGRKTQTDVNQCKQGWHMTR